MFRAGCTLVREESLRLGVNCVLRLSEDGVFQAENRFHAECALVRPVKEIASRDAQSNLGCDDGWNGNHDPGHPQHGG